MPRQGWSGAVATGYVDGTAVTGTAIGSILPPSAVWTMPANFLEVGSKLRIQAHGRVSNIVTTPGTLIFTMRLAGSIAAAVSVGLQLNALAKGNVGWFLDWTMDCRSIGSGTTATFMHNGMWTSESVVGSPLPAAGGNGSLMLQPVTPVIGTGFSSVAAATVDLMATFSLTGNSIQAHGYTLESLN